MRRATPEIAATDTTRERDAVALDWKPLSESLDPLVSQAPPAQADTDALDDTHAPQTS